MFNDTIGPVQPATKFSPYILTLFSAVKLKLSVH